MPLRGRAGNHCGAGGYTVCKRQHPAGSLVLPAFTALAPVFLLLFPALRFPFFCVLFLSLFPAFFTFFSLDGRSLQA